MRLIPGKTKVEIELFKGVSVWDCLIGGIGLLMVILVILSSLPFKFYICLGILFFVVALLARIDTEPNYVMILHMLRHFGYVRRYHRPYDDQMLEKRITGKLGEEFLEEYREKNDQLEFPGETEVEGGEGEEPAPEEAEEPEAKKDKKPEKAKKPEKKPAKKPEKKPAPAKASGLSEKELRKQEDKILKSKTATDEEKDAVWLARAQRSAAKKEARQAAKNDFSEETANTGFMEQIMPFTGIKDGFIEYAGKYYGVAIEVDPVEFRFFSEFRRRNSIELGLGRVLRGVHQDYCANIVKIERPVLYDSYLAKEEAKIEAIRKSFESGMLSEEELKARVEVARDRIDELKSLCFEDKVVAPFYYIVLFDSDRSQLELQVKTAMTNLSAGEMTVRRLNDRELAIFLKYTNQIDFDEREIDKIAPEDYAAWAMPQTLNVKFRTVEVNSIVTHNFRVVNYPMMVGDAYLAGVLSHPATKVVIKCAPMDRGKAIRSIDRSLQELRGQYNATGIDSKRIELDNHITTLSELLATLQSEGEELMECNIYITAYDIQQTRALYPKTAPESILPTINNMRRNLRRTWQESNFRLNNMEFDQIQAFIGSQVSAYDPESKEGRGIPSNTVAAAYPWIYAHISDEGGFKLGESDGVPVFIDFFRRDSERVNSNMVIIGKSGSGKSYATKSLLTNLAAEDAKIFILDPENEYAELAKNLHGKMINVANSQYGRLNPFQIITALDDDEGGDATGSFATHLQFLEEFFRQILPELDKDSLEYLNTLTERLYTDRGIGADTNLSELTPEDYPIFDDLYDAVLSEFERTDNEYLRSMLRTLVNYIGKFSTGGRNANIWNGPSSVTTDENFTVFNFQAMLSNRNTTIANAQMLLVLKYIDNEIIKNREYNERYHLKRKIVVVIDEAHVFIDTKFPVALDFMFQLAKRIRKYNGMQIVITQNIKDFVGSEEIARKSTAIINACQYSFIFALAPNDMHDLCKLYEKAGGINENEQEQIIQAPRGQAFTIMSASSRSTFKVEVPKNMVDMFQEREYESKRFSGTEGENDWEAFVAGSREANKENTQKHKIAERSEAAERAPRKPRVTFEEITEEEALRSKSAVAEKAAVPAAPAKTVPFEEVAEDEDFGDFDDADLDARIAALAQQHSGEDAPEASAQAPEMPVTAAAPKAVTAAPAPVLPVAPVQNTVPVPSAEDARTDAMNAMKEAALEFMRAVNAEIKPAAPAPQRGVGDMEYEELRSRLIEELRAELPAAAEVKEEKSAPEPQVDIEELTAQIRAQLMEEIMAELKESGALATPAEKETLDEYAGTEESAGEEQAIGNIFDILSQPAESSEEESEEEGDTAFDFSTLFDPDVPSEETEESASEGSFDIMSLLRSEAAMMSDEDLELELDDISDLVEPGEVAEISLEELAALVKLVRKQNLVA